MNKTDKAFSLVEVAVVIIIGGLLIAAFSSYIINYITSTKIKTTESRIEQVRDAMVAYANTNKKLPCVASRIAPIDTPNYGREVGTNCPAAPSGAAAGNISVAHAGKQIRIGAVPTRDINLPDEYGYDAWGSRLIYAVTENQTATNGYDPAEGAINLIDSAGNDILNPANSALFVVVSVGADRKGGYTSTGSLTDDCLAASATGLDVENCNENGVFRQTLITSTSAGATFYDDYLAYAGANTTAVPTEGKLIGSAFIYSKSAFMPANPPSSICKTTWGEITCDCNVYTGMGPVSCTVTCTRGEIIRLLQVPPIEHIVIGHDSASPGVSSFFGCLESGGSGTNTITFTVPHGTAAP